MQQIPVEINSHLRLDIQELSSDTFDAIQNALTISVKDEIIKLYTLNDNHLIMPRGFARKLAEGLSVYSLQPKWIDKRTLIPAAIPSDNGILINRDYQTQMIAKMLLYGEGVSCAPPGAGKTTYTAKFISRVKQKSLVLTNRSNIAAQWRDEIKLVTGYDCGLIGDNKDEDKDINIALLQTIWSRFDRLKEVGFFDEYGVVVLDECHSISANTVQHIFGNFSAMYRIGLSATPDRSDEMVRVRLSIIGDVFHEISHKQLEEEGVSVKPEIQVYTTPTSFKWKYGSSIHTAQWHKLVNAIIEDKKRNHLIGKIMGDQRGHCCLVQTDRLNHLHELAAYALSYGWPDSSVFIMTKDQNLREREEIIRRAEDGDCIIFSTIGKEALNIKRLDRFFIVYPGKNDAMTRQMIGRPRRFHADKEKVIIYDFYDNRIPMLVKHFHRRRGVYEEEGLAIKINHLE